MRRTSTWLSTAAAATLAACTAYRDVSANTVVTCSASSECPGGRICNQRGRCVDPDAMDTTPPDLDPGSEVSVSPPRGRAGQRFTVTLRATEPLDALTVTLGLVPPVALSCSAAPAAAFECAYTATGHENDDLGGDIALDVRMQDLAGNDTFRSSVATVTFDFTPPSPTLASVAYEPDTATNPLPSPTLATSGTRVRVAVAASERLAATAPTLVGRLGAVVLPFSLAQGGLGEHDAVFVATVAHADPDGAYTLAVTWSDDLGNAGTAAVPAVVQVKTSTPTLTVNQAAVVFVRSPWGNASPEDLGGYTIPAGPYFALDPPDPLSAATCLAAGTFLLDGGVVPNRIQVWAGTMPVGILLPHRDGTWPRQKLASPDALTAQVVGYDDAGNPSDPQPIATVEWVATSNLPPVGDSPHAVRRTPLVEASRVQRTEVEDVTPADVAGADGTGAVAVAEEVWRSMRTADAEGAVADTALAYDSARGRVVRFGGNMGGPLQEVREWDGAGWIDLTPASGSPPARERAALAYDGARDRVVLFGGNHVVSGITVPLADTWEWDGTRWQQRLPAVAPPGRDSAGMAYDSARARVVLFGGSGDAGILGDTWEWDGESWTSVARTGPGPGPRTGHALAHDAARGRTVLHGGATDGVVWEWDGASWTSIAPAGPGPVAGASAAMAWDPGRARAVVFGSGNAVADPGGVWEWDGATWTSLAVAGASPFFYAAPVAHDAVRGRAVLLTNRSSGTGKGTWEWDGGWWRNVTPSGAHPPGRYTGWNPLAYDSGRRRMVLWGGAQDVPLAAWDGSTWEWDGASWTSVASTASGPPRITSTLAYDVAHQRTVAVEWTGTTWSWDGGSWTSVTPATTQASGTLAYDATRGRIVVLDGSGAWAWTGADWTAMPAPGVGARPLAVCDDLRGRVLAYDSSPLDIEDLRAQPVWAWDGSGWTSIASSGTTPPLRRYAAMAFDSERGRALLFGGTAYLDGGVALQDTWEWDGSTWRDATPAGTKPFPRRDLMLAYDAHRRRTVLFGGHDAGGGVIRSDTWELEARPGTRPAIQLDASAARTGIAPGAIAGMRVRAWAGGRFTVGDPGAAGTAGATLRGWSTHSAEHGPGGWVPLATNGAGAGAAPPTLGPPSATLLAWTASSAAEARRFITERDGRLSFQVVPSGTMGPDPGGARVALDYVEVRVRYGAIP